MRKKPHDHKALLNQLWKECVDKGLRINVGRGERFCIDESIWKAAKKERNVRKPKPNEVVGYEEILRWTLSTILYKEGDAYRRKRVVDIFYVVEPEGGPL